MEYVYAALMLHSAKQPVNEDNVKKVMAAAGIKVEDAKVKSLIASLEGVNIDEAMQKAVAVPAATAAPAGAEGEKKEKKKPEDEGKKEEEAAGDLAALFG